ncbi:hypothetical protein Tco_0532416 [Tanacetum coccineum]
MIENQLVDVMEVVKEINLNKQVFEDNNEFESDIEDVLLESADLNNVIACPQNVLPDTDPEEMVCKNPSRARDKCGLKGR